MFSIISAIGVPVVTCRRSPCAITPDRILTVSGSWRWVTKRDWPGRRLSRSSWMSSSVSVMPRRAAIDHAADRRPMAFAEGRDAEEVAEGVVRHMRLGIPRICGAAWFRGSNPGPVNHAWSAYLAEHVNHALPRLVRGLSGLPCQRDQQRPHGGAMATRRCRPAGRPSRSPARRRWRNSRPRGPHMPFVGHARRKGGGVVPLHLRQRQAFPLAEGDFPQPVVEGVIFGAADARRRAPAPSSSRARPSGLATKEAPAPRDRLALRSAGCRLTSRPGSGRARSAECPACPGSVRRHSCGLAMANVVDGGHCKFLGATGSRHPECEPLRASKDEWRG